MVATIFKATISNPTTTLKLKQQPRQQHLHELQQQPRQQPQHLRQQQQYQRRSFWFQVLSGLSAKIMGVKLALALSRRQIAVVK